MEHIENYRQNLEQLKVKLQSLVRYCKEVTENSDDEELYAKLSQLDVTLEVNDEKFKLWLNIDVLQQMIAVVDEQLKRVDSDILLMKLSIVLNWVEDVNQDVTNGEIVPGVTTRDFARLKMLTK